MLPFIASGKLLKLHTHPHSLKQIANNQKQVTINRIERKMTQSNKNKAIIQTVNQSSETQIHVSPPPAAHTIIRKSTHKYTHTNEKKHCH